MAAISVPNNPVTGAARPAAPVVAVGTVLLGASWAAGGAPKITSGQGWPRG